MDSDRRGPGTSAHILRLDELLLIVALAAILTALVVHADKEAVRFRREPDVVIMPWSILAVFAGWLACWVVLHARSWGRARRSGGGWDPDPWVLALLTVIFVADRASRIWVIKAFSLMESQRLATVWCGLFLLPLAGAYFVVWVSLSGPDRPRGRRLLFALASLALATAHHLMNLMNLTETSWPG